MHNKHFITFKDASFVAQLYPETFSKYWKEISDWQSEGCIQIRM